MIKITLYKIADVTEAPISHSFQCEQARIEKFHENTSLIMQVDDTEIEIPFPMPRYTYINGHHWDSFVIEEIEVIKEMEKE